MATLIITIAAAAFVAVFAGFNIGNNCDVSLIFHTFKDIPVFVTALVSFAAGAMVSLPIAIRYRILKNKKAAGDEAGKKALKSAQNKGECRPQSDASGKNKGFAFFGRRRNKALSGEASGADPSSTASPKASDGAQEAAGDSIDAPKSI